MAGAGYERDSSSADTEETGTETESTRGFVLQDDDGGDKFVVKVRRSRFGISLYAADHQCLLIDIEGPHVQHVCVYHDGWKLQVPTRAQYLCP